MSDALLTMIHQHARLLKELEVVNRALIQDSHKLARVSRNGAAKVGTALPRGSKRRSWYERGEAIELMKKLATKPIAQADLVRAMAAKKPKYKTLSTADQKRFQSATYQAIANAIGAKKLFAGKDGLVRSVR